MPGCALHPRSRVQIVRKRSTRAYRFSGGIRHSLRNGFTAYSVLSPVSRSSVATVAPEKRELPGNLTPAYGRQDHTSLPYASVALVSRNIGVHRIPSRACDDRETPLVPGRDHIDVSLIWAGRQVNF